MERYRGLTQGQFHLIDVPIEDVFFEIDSPGNPETLLAAGSICERKNLMTLLRALALVKVKHPGVRLLVCGKELDRSYAAACRSFAVKNQLGESVEFLGLVARDDMPKYIRRAGIVALPSRQETAPGVICQAMAAGRPVVASNVGGIPFLVEEGATGFLCEPDDYVALADRIDRLISDPGLRAQMSELARSTAKKRFRAEVVAAKTLEVCRLAAGYQPLSTGAQGLAAGT